MWWRMCWLWVGVGLEAQIWQEVAALELLLTTLVTHFYLVLHILSLLVQVGQVGQLGQDHSGHLGLTLLY